MNCYASIESAYRTLDHPARRRRLLNLVGLDDHTLDGLVAEARTNTSVGDRFFRAMCHEARGGDDDAAVVALHVLVPSIKKLARGDHDLADVLMSEAGRLIVVSDVERERLVFACYGRLRAAASRHRRPTPLSFVDDLDRIDRGVNNVEEAVFARLALAEIASVTLTPEVWREWLGHRVEPSLVVPGRSRTARRVAAHRTTVAVRKRLPPDGIAAALLFVA